jgi:hypothetical protein
MAGEPEDAAARHAEPFTFSSLVLSLSTSALMHLGIGPGTEGESSEPKASELAMASQTIEILEVLQVKTEGNLDETERQLLEQALHELHMRFVEIKSRA